MEKRIKILYIITIIAILTFLGMQLYWLYGRYQFSLKECESQLSEKVEEAFNIYHENRWYTNSLDTAHNMPSRVTFGLSESLSQELGDKLTTRRTATVTTYHLSASELLGLKNVSSLSPEQREEAFEKAFRQHATKEDKVYDATSAPSEGYAWNAARNVKLESETPFTTEGLDSCLSKEGVKAKVELVKTDSMEWNRKMIPARKLYKPSVTFYYPYSELECKSVKIICPIHLTDIIYNMADILAIMVISSILLIICLIWQFSTVLKLSRLDKMRNTFVTTMIHELKRPISTLKMCVSGIENEKMLADKDVKAELMSNARYALDNLSAYFSKLRDIIFNDVEQIPLNIIRINLYNIVDKIISTVAVPATKQVEFDNTIDPAMEISADRSHIYSIITNLVENAIKYSREEVTITISASRSDDWVMITVADTGIGITESEINNIFNRFYRGKSSLSEIPGMGLGLTYVKLLVEAHGGNVRVDSIFGYGSTFTITLPQ